jgi:hypothetical protein
LACDINQTFVIVSTDGNKLVLFSSEIRAPLVLDKILATNREPKTMMQVITQEFFATIKTLDGQAFVKFGEEDIYSVKANSGVYLFTVRYVSELDENYIDVIVSSI